MAGRSSGQIAAASILSEMNTIDLETHLESEEQQREKAIQTLRHLVGQMIHGCNNPQCHRQYCHTGRTNTKSPPVRHYTIRSARALAMMLLAEPSVEKHLCPDYRLGDDSESLIELPHRKDPKSLMQQVSDTRSFRKVLSPEPLTGQKEQAWDTVFNFATRKLDCLFEPPLQCSGRVNPAFQDNHAAAGIICSAMIVYPKFDGWPGNFALLDYPPYLSLCNRICEVIAYRWQLEETLAKYSKSTYGVNSLRTALYNKLSLVMSGMDACAFSSLLESRFLDLWDGCVNLKKNTTAYGALALLETVQMRCAREGPALDPLNPQVAAFVHIASKLRWEDVATTWLDCASESAAAVHLASLPWLHLLQDISKWFRGTCVIRMNRATALARTNEELTTHYMTAGTAAMSVALRRAERLDYERSHYLTLSVSRENVVTDSFEQIWQRHKSELLRPLKVRFGEDNGLEIGQDLGGVQIEFFNALFTEIFHLDTGDFEQLEGTGGRFYFSPGSLAPLWRFETIGIYMALALYNGVAIPISFPLAFYRHLLHLECDEIAHINDGWPDTARLLQQLLDDSGSTDLEYAFPMQANGLRLSINQMGFQHLREQIATAQDSQPLKLQIAELSLIDNATPRADPSDPTNPHPWAHLLDPPQEWPGWKVVTQENPDDGPTINDALRKPYVRDSVAWLTTLRVYPQLTAIRKGFTHIFSEHQLRMFDPSGLKLTLEGRSEISVSALQQASSVQGFALPQDQAYIDAFWRLVSSWPQEKVKALVKFVTAAERVPATESFGIKIEKMEGGEEGRLPHSSTCFATLFLPVYAEVHGENGMEGKLGKAVEMGWGFGMA